jgi:hypothetical protein
VFGRRRLVGAAEETGDLPGAAFFDVAHLVTAEAADGLHRGEAGFT